MNIQQILEKEEAFIHSLPLSWAEKVKLSLTLYRALTWDSQAYTVLHGSTSITKRGNPILFGDGVNCLGKTTTALIVACSSGQFVIDEFSLYNQITKSVYGNSESCISFRNDAIKYLKDIGIKIPKSIDINKDSGVHIKPSLLGLSVVSFVRLKAIVSPHPFDKSFMVEETNPVAKMRKLAVLSNAHRLKWVESSLDRVDGKSDKKCIIELDDYTPGYKIPDGLFALPYYDAYLKEPKDIIKLLNKEGL